MAKFIEKHKRILILAEMEDRKLASITFELLRAGREIANKVAGSLCVAVLGHEIGDVSHEAAYFADEIYSLNHSLLANFDPQLYSSALKQLYEHIDLKVIFMSQTLDNLSLAPVTAFKIGAQVITDCIRVAFEAETGHLLCTKPVYGAKFLSTFKLEKEPYLVTLRPKAFEPIKPSSKLGEIIHFDPVVDKKLSKVEVIENVKQEIISLNKANAIVSGGRGVKNSEGLHQLKELVEALRRHFLKVELGASRPLVDARLVPPSRQIGLTGEKVAPELYIAVGISGSLQHITGILGAKTIIAINSDPKAHIFQVADYGVIGNFEEVVRALAKRLEDLS